MTLLFIPCKKTYVIRFRYQKQAFFQFSDSKHLFCLISSHIIDYTMLNFYSSYTEKRQLPSVVANFKETKNI